MSICHTSWLIYTWGMFLMLMWLQIVLGPLLTIVKDRLGAQDQDQEVRECAISCTATMLATLGDSLPVDVPALLQVHKIYFAEHPSKDLTLTVATFSLTHLARELCCARSRPVLSCRFCWTGCAMRPPGWQLSRHSQRSQSHPCPWTCLPCWSLCCQN